MIARHGAAAAQSFDAGAAGDGVDRQALGFRGVHPDRRARLLADLLRRRRRTCWVEHLLTSLPGGQLGFLIVVNVLRLRAGVLPRLLRDRLHRHCRCSGRWPTSSASTCIWFGVLLGVNMQTSFMHPPFGFALFYLRIGRRRANATSTSAPAALTDGVTTGQIYWGAIPSSSIQLIMVVLAIAFPQMIMHYKGAENANPQTIEIFTQPPSDQAKRRPQPAAGPRPAARSSASRRISASLRISASRHRQIRSDRSARGVPLAGAAAESGSRDPLRRALRPEKPSAGRKRDLVAHLAAAARPV